MGLKDTHSIRDGFNLATGAKVEPKGTSIAGFVGFLAGRALGDTGEAISTHNEAIREQGEGLQSEPPPKGPDM